MTTHKTQVSFIHPFVLSSISSLSSKRKPGGGVKTTTTALAFPLFWGLLPFSSTFSSTRALFVNALSIDQILHHSLDVYNFDVGRSGRHAQPPAQSLHGIQSSTATASAESAALQYTNSQARARACVPLSRLGLEACSSLISTLIYLSIPLTNSYLFAYRQLHNHGSTIHPNSSPSRPSPALPR